MTLDEITKAGLSAKRFFAATIGGYELRRKIETGDKVSIVAHGLDDYGRTLAYVYLADGRCLNEMLIRNGAALAKYSHARSAAYREMEREAREGKIGFWKTLWKENGK